MFNIFSLLYMYTMYIVYKDCTQNFLKSIIALLNAFIKCTTIKWILFSKFIFYPVKMFDY